MVTAVDVVAVTAAVAARVGLERGPSGPVLALGLARLQLRKPLLGGPLRQPAGGRPGTGPMGGPMGGGKGKGDEDNEHERKYLIEADSEDTFGSDVLTAPQVIGDDEYED